MTRSTQAPLCALALSALLSACGGGGGDDDQSSPATREDVELAAKLGAATIELTAQRMEVLTAFFTGFLQGLSTDPAGTRPLNVSCVIGGVGSGTYTGSITKSAVRTGLAAGDTVALTFNSCDFSSVGLVLNGNVTLTAQDTIANQAAGSASSFRIAASQMNITFNGSATLHDGVIDVVASLPAEAVTQRFTVPGTGNYVFAVLGLGYGFKPGAVFASTTSSSSGSRKLDGTVSASVSTGSGDLVFITPTPLTGSVTSNQFAATAGAFSLSLPSESLGVSVAFNGSVATVSGDTDGNGTSDVNFETTWAQLLAP
jgi:hypothetical protein